MSNDPIAPLHYGGKDNPYETIKVARARLSPAQFEGAMRFNVQKYVDRYPDKKGLEDLEKAYVYLGWLIEHARKHGLESHPLAVADNEVRS